MEGGPIQAAAAMVVLGLALTSKAIVSRKRLRHVKNFPSSTIRGAAIGLVELHGTVVGDKQQTSPITKTPCVFCMYDIAINQGQRGYHEIKTVYQGDQLQITDGTGTIPIDPRGAEFLFRTKYHYIKSWKATPEEKHFLEANNMYNYSHDTKWKKFRVREYIFEPGQEIYVMGRAQDNPAIPEASQTQGHKDLLIGKDEDSDLFFIGEKGQDHMLRKLYAWMISGFLFGPLSLLLGLGLVIIAIARNFA